MSDLVESLKKGVSMLKRRDDDMFDRLSNRYTIGEKERGITLQVQLGQS